MHANYKRLKQASDQQPGLVAAQELEDALAKDQAAAAQVDAAKSAVAAAQGQLGVSRAESQRVSSMEQYATITAPYNGVVTMRYADTGALIPAGTAEGLNQAVVRLAQSDVLRLRMPVPERDVPLVHIGSVVTVHVQATGQQFPGTVVRFSRDVSNATRTMLTEVDVKNPDLTLTPGMYADVTFNLEEKNNALIVPASDHSRRSALGDARRQQQSRRKATCCAGHQRCKSTGGDLGPEPGRSRHHGRISHSAARAASHSTACTERPRRVTRAHQRRAVSKPCPSLRFVIRSSSSWPA